MKRVVALDVGSVRTGVALSDPFGTFAQPVGHVKMNAQWLDQLAKLVNLDQVETIVIGLPKGQKGDEGESALRARNCADQVRVRWPQIQVVLVDERFTTAVAQRLLIEADVSRSKRKGVVDAMAAQLILQNYLDGQRSCQ